MKKKEILSTVYETSSLSELGDTDVQLIRLAREAAFTAYAPYSGFQVGAAVRLENGVSFTGSNQENSSFPAGLCAERVAVFYAKSQFPESAVQSLAVAVKSKGKDAELPSSPCGCCLQALFENEEREGKPIRILLYGTALIMVGEDVRQFLPLGFGRANLYGK